MKMEIIILEWGNDGMGKELMGENGKQTAAPWHDLVIDVDICFSLLDEYSGAVPSSPIPESIAGDFNFYISRLDSTTRTKTTTTTTTTAKSRSVFCISIKMETSGFAVLDNFSCAKNSEILNSKCSVLEFFEPAGCGSFSILDGIRNYPPIFSKLIFQVRLDIPNET